MEFTFSHRRAPMFTAQVSGNAGTQGPATGSQDAQNAVTGGSDSVDAEYNAIFAKEMENQAELYGVITKLNDKKNAQSSYLTLAKSVSEKVQ